MIGAVNPVAGGYPAPDPDRVGERASPAKAPQARPGQVPYPTPIRVQARSHRGSVIPT